MINHHIVKLMNFQLNKIFCKKISALSTQSYLEKEAMKSKREDFDKVLKAVPAVEPIDYDKIT